jgi:hypothetical protein
MEEYTFKVDYYEKYETLHKLSDLVSDFVGTLSPYHYPKGTEQEVLDNLYKIIKERANEIKKTKKELMVFFNEKMFSFWKMTIVTTNIHGDEYKKEYFVYPYGVVMENNYFKCIYFKKDSYTTAFDDGGFMLDELVDKNCTITFQKITQEEFLAEHNNCVNNILNKRLNKIKEENA